MSLKQSMTQMFIERGKVIQAMSQAGAEFSGFGQALGAVGSAKTQGDFEKRKKEAQKQLTGVIKTTQDIKPVIDAWEAKTAECEGLIKEELNKIEQKRKEIQAVNDFIDKTNEKTKKYNKEAGLLFQRPLLEKQGFEALDKMAAALKEPQGEVDNEKTLIKAWRDWQSNTFPNYLKEVKGVLDKWKFDPKGGKKK